MNINVGRLTVQLKNIFINLEDKLMSSLISWMMMEIRRYVLSQGGL